MTFKSVELLKLLSGSIKAYVDSVYPQALAKRVVHDIFAVPFFELDEARQDITFARVAIFEQLENSSDFVGAAKPTRSTQLYGVDLSVVRAYSRDNSADNAEVVLMQLRDIVVEWAKNVDVAELTNGYIYSISYLSSQPKERNDRFTNRTLVLGADRDLQKSQIT